jgi:hypothetical protein
VIHMKIAQQSVKGNRVEVTNFRFLVISLRLAQINLITILSQLRLYEHICVQHDDKFGWLVVLFSKCFIYFNFFDDKFRWKAPCVEVFNL